MSKSLTERWEERDDNHGQRHEAGGDDPKNFYQLPTLHCMKSLRPTERIASVSRRHPASLTGWMALIFLLIMIPGVFSVPLVRAGTVGRWVFIILLLIPIMFALDRIVQWYGTTVTVTDRRILAQRQLGFFHQEVQEIPYENIGLVTVSRHGVLQHFLRYGSLRVRTIDGGEIVFESIPYPDAPATYITQRLAHYRGGTSLHTP